MTEANWRVAPSLDQLLLEVNTGAPNRDKSSDGAHASPQHTAANPSSDHEAWYLHDGMHWVTARDFTHDPAGGFDGQLFVNALVYMKDPRIKYIIFNRLIYNPNVQSWKPRHYEGVNPHTKHVHVSVKADPISLDPYAWLLPGLFETEDDMALTPSDVWGFPVHNNYTGDDPDDVMTAGVALEWAMARASQAKEAAEVTQSTVQRIEAQVARNNDDLNRKLEKIAEHFGVYL